MQNLFSYERFRSKTEAQERILPTLERWTLLNWFEWPSKQVKILKHYTEWDFRTWRLVRRDQNGGRNKEVTVLTR